MLVFLFLMNQFCWIIMCENIPSFCIFISHFTFVSSSFFLLISFLLSVFLSSAPSCVSPAAPCRSRLSWGQMLGCYAHSGFSVSGFDPADCPSGLQSPWIRMCFHSRRHFYPVAFLLVTSHLLVLWLIFSLVILLAKYQ